MGSLDHLRQCIKAVVEQGPDYKNVVVTVRESLRTEYVVALEISGPVYRDQQVHPEGVYDGEDVSALRRKVEETQHFLMLAAT